MGCRYYWTMRPNPFSPGTVRPAEFLVGRDGQLSLVDRLINQISSGYPHSPICFLAPGGSGKTTLLRRISSELQTRHWLCGYTQASTDTATAIQDLLFDARNAFPREGIGARIRSRVQEISITAGPIGAGLKLGNVDNPNNPNVTVHGRLIDLLTKLAEAARLDGVGVVLLVDEVQVLSYEDIDLMLSAVNSLYKLPVAAIMAGLPNIPHIISSGPRSAFYVEYSNLNAFTWEEAYSALTVPVKSSGGDYESDTAAPLIEYSNGHPLVLQMLGSRAWIQAEQESSSGDRSLLIKRRHAEAAIASTRAELVVSVHRPVWARCTNAERMLLSTLAASADSALSERELFSSRKLAGIDPQETLDNLMGNGIVYAPEDDDVRFVVPGFSDFVRRRSPEPDKL